MRSVQDNLKEALAQQTETSFKFDYPTSLAKQCSQVDKYKAANGNFVSVADPYRWLEKPDSAETKAWIAAERKLTDSYFAQSDIEKKVEEKMATMKELEALGLPTPVGGNSYFVYGAKGR